MAKKCHNHRLQANPWHRKEGTQRRHSTSTYNTIRICIFQVPFPFNVNKCSDKTKIRLDIGSALLDYTK